MRVCPVPVPGLARLILVLVATCLSSPASAQGLKPQVPFEGSHGFRHLLDRFHAEPLKQIADLGADPKTTLLVVFGDTAVLGEVAEVTGGLDNFRKAGGSILIATDRRDHEWLADLNIQISGRPVSVVEWFETGYRGQADCPLVASFLMQERRHPLFVGLKQPIATNRPSYLTTAAPAELETLASFLVMRRHRPAWRAEDGTSSTFKLPFESVPFIMGTGADSGPQGRVVVMAGHGVFMNGMIGQPDNDNFPFALNCVRWLTGADHGLRKRVLFIEEGKVQSNFKVPLAELPLPPLPPAQVVNDLLRGLEEENAFNRFLLEGLGRDRILQVVFLALSAGLLFWGWRRLRQARHRVELAVPLVDRSVARRLSAPPVLAQRRQELLRQGNLWEAARALARHCFDSYPGAGTDLTPPALVVKGDWWQRWKLRRLVCWLWDLAYGAEAVSVSARRLARVRAGSEQVRAALQAGTLVFVPPDAAACALAQSPPKPQAAEKSFLLRWHWHE